MICSWSEHIRALVLQLVHLSAVHWLVSSADAGLLGDLSALGHLCGACESWRVRCLPIMELSLQEVLLATAVHRRHPTHR